MGRVWRVVFPLGHTGLALAFRRLAGARVKSADALPLAWVAVGAMLPDAIDKPLGHVLLPELNNGRIVAHTLLFVLVLAAAAWWVGRRRGDGDWHPVLAALAFGAATHLLLDRMFYSPETLLWPLFGWGFPAMDFHLGHWLDALRHDRYVQAGEVLGGIVLAWEAWRWWRGGRHLRSDPPQDL